MESSAPTDLPSGIDSDEPLVGSYFVSAYPPFACWHQGARADFRERLARPAGEAFGLYVHIPFCVERCRYCYYLSYDDRPQEIDRYLDAVAAELELYARTPRFRGRGPDFVYFGGGTPSLLSVGRIRSLLGRLQQAMPWSSTRETTFECAPRSVSAGKLAALRDLGVTRVSLGIQQLDDRVLRLNGRVHLVADVERAWRAIRRTRFPVANVDLIAGLVGETDESFRTSLERVVAMGPEMVTLYPLEIPHNTPLFRDLEVGRPGPAPPGWEVRRRRLGAAFRRLEEAGYVVRSAYAAVRDADRHRFVYQDEQYRGVDLLGVGVSSFSYLDGVHQQNLAALPLYLDRMERGELPLGRAYALDATERMVRELVLGLKLGAVDAGRLRRKFGVDPRQKLAAPLAHLRRLGAVELDGDTIRLTRFGLLRADRLIRSFYLPEHREDGASRKRRSVTGL